MRKIIAATFVSLDGVMQAPGGPEEDPTGGFAYGGWSFNYWDDAMMEIDGQVDRRPLRPAARPQDLRDLCRALALHRGAIPIADKFNARRPNMSRRRRPRRSAWKNSVAIRGDAAQAIAG